MSRTTMLTWSSLAAGSLAGGFARYLLAVAVHRALINVVGSVVIGLILFRLGAMAGKLI